MLLHPLGSLTVKQSVVPLEFDISRFGQSVPAGTNRFTLGVDLTGHALDTTKVDDFFARAQFVKMTDDEKLSAPSFELMVAGVTMSSDDFSFRETEAIGVNTIAFETWIMDEKTNTLLRSESELPKKPKDPVTHYHLSAELFMKQARFGAAGTSELRRTGSARYRTTAIAKNQIAKEGWTIITEELQPADKPASYSKAVESLEQIKQQNPAKAARLTIVRLSEINTK